MCDPDVEGPEAYSETWRKARKRHRCCACGEAIAPGHRYHYISGVWRDAGAQSFKHCARCWLLYEAIVEETDPANGVDLRLDCGETWRSLFGADGPAYLAFLTAEEAQERVRDA